MVPEAFARGFCLSTNWLLELGLLPLALLFCGGGTLLFVLGAVVFGSDRLEAAMGPANDLAGNKLDFMAPLAAVVMLFVVAMAWFQYDRLQESMGRETTRLVLLTRAISPLDAARRQPLEHAIGAYAAAVAGPEWQAMHRGDRSQQAAQRLEELVRAFTTFSPAGQSEQRVLRFAGPLIRELGGDRETRIEAATFAWDGALTAMMVLMLSLSATMSLFVRIPDMATKITMGGLFSSGIMLVALYGFLLIHPFAGPARLSNEAYLHVAALATADGAADHGR